jgi:hypothetical protein
VSVAKQFGRQQIALAGSTRPGREFVGNATCQDRTRAPATSSALTVILILFRSSPLPAFTSAYSISILIEILHHGILLSLMLLLQSSHFGTKHPTANQRIGKPEVPEAHGPVPRGTRARPREATVGEVGLRKHRPRPPTLAPSVCLRLRADVGDPSLHRALTKH